MGGGHTGGPQAERRMLGAVLRVVVGLPVGLAVAAGVGYLVGARPGDVARYAAGVSPWLIAAGKTSAPRSAGPVAGI